MTIVITQDPTQFRPGIDRMIDIETPLPFVGPLNGTRTSFCAAPMASLVRNGFTRYGIPLRAGTVYTFEAGGPSK